MLPNRDNFICMGVYCLYVMADETELSAELYDTYTTNRRSIAKEITAHIKVLESGEWVGDFFATFTRKRVTGSDQYVADWASVTQGNGLYVDEEPPFWPVEEIADVLNEKYSLENFIAINSGPNDK